MNHESWKSKIREQVQALHQLKSQLNKKHTYFSISTTSKVPLDKVPFITPVRVLEDGVVIGTVVFSQTQAEVACLEIDGHVDYILVDLEKKLPVSFDVGEAVRSDGQSKSIAQFEMGNLSLIVRKTAQKSQVIGYKPNDLTVEAAWHLSSSLFEDFSGRKIAILGCGNIGFKLAMKFVESGAHVFLNRRDLTRGMLMANVINLNKPPTTLAHAYFEPDSLKACLFADLVIGASSGGPIIDINMLKVLRPNSVVVDIGKGTLFPTALEYCFENSIRVFRCDVSSALYGYISALRNTQELLNHQMGRRELVPTVNIVSGGAVGRRGDWIVDDFRKPTIVYGIADGEGDLIRNDLFPGFKQQFAAAVKSGYNIRLAFKQSGD